MRQHLRGCGHRRNATPPSNLLCGPPHRAGLRFRVHQRPLPELRREADIMFRRARLAVFVDGCFWHGCPDHGTLPVRNAAFWRAKIEGNAGRDQQTDTALRKAGWLAIRIWEHEDSNAAAERVAVEVRRRMAVFR